MRFKLDENLDPGLVALLAREGHDVDTVRNEGLSGAPDHAIYEACVLEGRALITLDLDFSNYLRFPPEPTEGIIILRPVRIVLPMIRGVLENALINLGLHPLKGMIWIAEPGRIRMFNPHEH